MSKFNDAITEAMNALDAEIAEVEGELEDLRATRANLEKVLVEDDGDTPSRKKVTAKVTTGRESTKAARITHMLQDGMSVKDIADELDITPNYVYTVRKNAGLDTGERGHRGRRSSNSNGDTGATRSRVTKRQRIKDMLNDDMSVKDIAEELGISPSYVYNVKNS